MSETVPSVNLVDVADIVPGTSPSGRDINVSGDGLPFYQGAKEFGTRHPRPERFTTAPVKTARAGDILLSVRAPVGRVNIADSDCAIGRGVMAVRAKDPADAPYLAWFLRTLGENWDAHATDGTMFANLSKKGLECLPVRWPVERCRIAEVLGALDDSIESCQAVAWSCDQFFHARWLCDFGDSQSVASGTLREFCNAQYGVTTSGKEEAIGPHLLRVKDINKSNWVDWRSVPYCDLDEKEFSKYKLHQGDVVVARMADPGKSAIIEVPGDAVFASYLIRLSPTIENANYFLFGFMKSRFFVDYSAASSSGSVQQNINAQTILDAPCAVPEPEVLQSFEEWAKRLRKGVVRSVEQLNALRDARDFLLPRLISGELRVETAEEVVEDVA